MKKFFLIVLCLLVIGFGVVACSSDDDTETETGSVQVNVITAKKIVGFPTTTETYDTAVTNTWLYADVDDEAYDDPILADDIGNQKYYVYLYEQLGDSSKDYAVAYNGEADTDGENPVAITINDVAVGDYYVVVFYDYASGGNQTNLLNRYDRYAFFMNDATGADGAAYSSPFVEDASTVTITKDQTLEIPSDDTVNDYVKAKKDWVLGKPGDGNGRLFLKTGDDIPDENSTP